MSATLTISVDEKTLAGIAAEAAQSGMSPDQIVAEYVARRFAPLPPVPPPGERKAGDIRRFFGSVSVGHPRGLDNEKIDEDLADEYGRGLPPRNG